jgi:hypothetical protein
MFRTFVTAKTPTTELIAAKARVTETLHQPDKKYAGIAEIRMRQKRIDIANQFLSNTSSTLRQDPWAEAVA